MIFSIKLFKPNALYFMTYIMLFLSSFVMSQEKKFKDSELTKLKIEKMISKINTEVSSEFIYDYHKTKFVPQQGKKLLIMGQTLESIKEYKDNFQNEPIPSGWSAYWGIPEFKGITESYKNDTGSTQNHQMLIDSFPNTVIQSAMWMVGKWDISKKAGKGDYDEVIKKYGAWAKSTNRPIYLRIGYEFDGSHNQLEPKKYIKAYKHIVDLLREEGVNNIAFVWHSYASEPFKDYKLSDWYPGDNYVDWIGISVFGHAYNSDFGTHCDDVLQFAKQKKKPVMIAESNPIKGIHKDNIDVWDQWFVNFFTFIYNKNIKAVSFINEDWERLYIEGISNWKDSRLFNNEKISRAWFMETNKSTYLKQSPELYEQLEYKKQK
ncbi:glycoside hydrolase family 26 protein [uncultured Psychroserpens sp.]|uniref:glycoside hydrolase family 26 protein n=1 Tax=uncultured Psychroserpens sp. TaxID=255436 RepID=UPI002620E3FF|nr:glycosyl hydrolase [uncultured Psychroserpens sp.]